MDWTRPIGMPRGKSPPSPEVTIMSPTWMPAPSRAMYLKRMVPRGSPLEGAFAGFRLQRTPMTLYSVHTPGSRFAARDFRTLSPGFEMALS